MRAELLVKSAASIDRYLKPAKAKDDISGVSTARPSPLLFSSIKIRRARDEVEAEPAFFEATPSLAAVPMLKGEFARTLTLTCVHTGWVFTRTVRNNSHAHILSGLKAGVDEIPFEVTRVWSNAAAPGRPHPDQLGRRDRAAGSATRSSPR